jgi:hypothetical protein
MQVQKDAAKLLNIKNWMQQQDTGMIGGKNWRGHDQEMSQRAIEKRRSLLMHVVAKLNF